MRASVCACVYVCVRMCVCARVHVLKRKCVQVFAPCDVAFQVFDKLLFRHTAVAFPKHEKQCGSSQESLNMTNISI